MKCLLRYRWVKLPRAQLPQGKGILGYWAKLAARAAFRKGTANYCGYRNEVIPGMWSGGIVGLKSILGVRRRAQALQIMDSLQELGYIKYILNEKTKRLEYQICDWVICCSGKGCTSGTVFATSGYGFLCLPRSITQRLVRQNYEFEEADALLDLWCHTTWQDSRNAFSFLAPTVQLGDHGAALTLEMLGQRWGWERTKVWRFFKKHAADFPLRRLPGSFGCLVFNAAYPTAQPFELPKQAQIERILTRIRILGKNTHTTGTDHARLCKMILWYSRTLHEETDPNAPEDHDDRVAVSTPIKYAYFSLCWNCKNCNNDCRECEIFRTVTGTDFDERKGKENCNEQISNRRIHAARDIGTAAPGEIRRPCANADTTRNHRECGNQEQTDAPGTARAAAPNVPQYPAPAGTVQEYRVGAGMLSRNDRCRTGWSSHGSGHVNRAYGS